MIQLLTQINVADNSGATKAKVIKILKPKNKKYAQLGDLVLVAIQKNIPHSKIRKGHIAKAILIRSNKRVPLVSHTQLWDGNHVILVNTKGDDYLPIGSRIKGPISSKLKSIPGMQKILSISKKTL